MPAEPQADGIRILLILTAPTDESYYVGQVVAADGTTYTVVRENYGECLTACYNLANNYGETPRKGVRP